MSEWIKLSELPDGAIFETQDGIRAVKSEYRYPYGGAVCVLLASGEYAHFAQDCEDQARRHDATLVRELRVDPEAPESAPERPVAAPEARAWEGPALTEETVVTYLRVWIPDRSVEISVEPGPTEEEAALRLTWRNVTSTLVMPKAMLSGARGTRTRMRKAVDWWAHWFLGARTGVTGTEPTPMEAHFRASKWGVRGTVT